jgi:hypothetical protein
MFDEFRALGDGNGITRRNLNFPFVLQSVTIQVRARLAALPKENRICANVQQGTTRRINRYQVDGIVAFNGSPLGVDSDWSCRHGRTPFLKVKMGGARTPVRPAHRAKKEAA